MIVTKPIRKKPIQRRLEGFLAALYDMELVI
jgi:hypothetical protein